MTKSREQMILVIAVVILYCIYSIGKNGRGDRNEKEGKGRKTMDLFGSRRGKQPDAQRQTETQQNAQPPRHRNPLPAGRGILIFARVVLALLLLIAVFNSGYMLDVNQTAVVTTFGVPASVTESGFHFKVPFVQQVHKISKEISGMEIGYDTSQTGENDPQKVSADSEMITNDFNFVDVDFYIEYQVTDPIRYYINRSSAASILSLLAKSYIRDTVGVYSVDDVITTGRAEIQAKVKEDLTNRLEEENIGLGIVNVTIQDAEPPTEEVQAAFKAVEDAKQGMDTKINQAKQYQSEQIPAANAKADKAAKDAEAYKQQRINEAEGQAARFNDTYAEYKKYPLITKKRMFYETMEDVLPDLKVVIDEGDGTQTMLPLEPFSGTEDSSEQKK
ncbi:MAG: FtsH protease activity modulator HflK [Lachnospiraceae bacterium]|jgi:membrane protease subunit HflK|nr:FtsH protease activity modulator HflK [Lachnospiraceae bacterium]